MAKRGTFIGSAYVSITGDDSSLGRVLAGVRKKMVRLGEDLRRLGLKLIAAGVAIQAPLTLAVTKFAELGDVVAKGAKRTGLSTEAYSELAHVVELAGAEITILEKGLKNLAKVADFTKQGLKTYTREFAKIGVTVTDTDGRLKGIEALFIEVGTAIGLMTNETERAAVAANIFGRAGTQLIPVFQLGAEGIRHYREEARRLGISIGPKMAAAAERLTDMFARMRAAFRGIVLVIGTTLAPSFDRVQVVLVNLISNVRRYLAANPQIISGLQKIAVTLIAIGAAFVAIGTATKALSVLVSPGGVLVALATILAFVSGLLDPLIEKWGKVVLGFQVGGRTIRDWLARLTEAWGEFVSAVKDIGAEFGTAFKAALPAISAAWAAVWESAKDGFLRLVRFVVSTLRDVLARLSGFFRGRARTASVFAQGHLEELAGLAAAASRGLAGGLVPIIKAQEGREGVAAAARARAGAAGGAFLEAAGGAGGRISARVKEAVDKIGKIGKEAVRPLLERIFGEKQAAKVDKFFDIFRGLGKQFREFQTPALAPAGGAAASRAGTLVSGTFAGRAEAIRGATTTTGLLRDIVTGIEGTNKILDRKFNAPVWADEEPL